MSSISCNLQAVKDRIAHAARLSSRDPDSVKLLAVSKTFGPEAVIAAAEAGQQAFGENYLQEALHKMQAVAAMRPDLLLEWHFIGPLQSNKTRPVAEHFDWVHAVDREKIAQRLSEQRPDHLPPLNICLQVNISGETSKSGVAPEEVLEMASRVAAFPRLKLRGLMTIPEPTDEVEKQHAAFRQLHVLLTRLQEQGLAMDALSMGMSSDLEAAIAEGASIVRIGTAIFGQRDYAK